MITIKRNQMRFTTTLLLACLAAPVLVLGLLRYHPWTGTGTSGKADAIHDGPNAQAMRELTVGFLPVTCHLTCPVTDYASKTTTSNTNFNSRLFTDFPTVASAFEAKQIQATFMIVPLAMKLREQGVPIKICYLGHRDGSEIIVGTRRRYAEAYEKIVGSTLRIG